MLTVRLSHCDPNVWSGRASQEFSLVWFLVLHQCIRPLIGAVHCSGPPWISARVRSFYRTDLGGPFGSPVFDRAGKTFSISSFTLADLGGEAGFRGSYINISSLCPLHFSLVRPMAFPSSRPARARGRGAQGRSRLAAALPSTLTPPFPGHALTGPSTAPASNRLGRRIGFPCHLEVAALGEHGPGDARELVGECNRQHVVVQAFHCGLDP
jgi:hypothetical protein